MVTSAIALFPAIGLLAGLVTTLAGMGGGMLAVIVVSSLEDPKTALAATAPALLLGNLHRAWMFRRDVHGPTAKAAALGALPGAVLGGLITVVIPNWLIWWLILGALSLAFLRAAGRFRWKPTAKQLVPGAFLAGFMSATAGAGLLLAPLILATGLTHNRFIGTIAVTACLIHVGRLVGYGTGGLLTDSTMELATLLAAGMIAGNFLGRAVRHRMTPRQGTALTYSTMMLCFACSLAELL